MLYTKSNAHFSPREKTSRLRVARSGRGLCRRSGRLLTDAVDKRFSRCEQQLRVIGVSFKERGTWIRFLPVCYASETLLTASTQRGHILPWSSPSNSGARAR